MKTLNKENTKKVANIKNNNAHTWKQVAAQLNDKKAIVLKDGTTLTPQEAWAVLNVPASKGGVAKAVDIKKAWTLAVGDGSLDSRSYRVRKTVTKKVTIGDKEYALHTDKNKKSAVKYQRFFNLKNATDKDIDRKEDVIISAKLVLFGLFDCKYKDDTLAEVDKSVKDAEAVVVGYIDMADKGAALPNWVHVAKNAEGNWVIAEGMEEAPVQAPIDLNVKTA